MKMPWNKFTEQYPKSIGFMAITKLPKLPKNSKRVTHDNSGKKLPTPYGALGGYLATILNGDWCMQSDNGNAIIKIISVDDAEKLQQVFGVQKTTTSLPGISNAFWLEFDIRTHYKSICQKLGYSL